MKRFTSVHDVVNGPGLDAMLRTAEHVTADPWCYADAGRRRTLGLLFFNPSLRTRMSTQKAAQLLGMDTIVMNVGSDSWTLETRDGAVMDGGATEHIREAAAVMGQYCDVLGIRTFAGLQDRDFDDAETVLESMITYSGVPVVSLESATRHPLQSFADLITIRRHVPVARPKVVLTWAPHPRALPQAVPNSFAEWMLAADVDLVITHPEGYELSAEYTRGATIDVNQDRALEGADVVYAKNWSSYDNYGMILSKDPSWMITPEKMSRTNNARFMHCLPVRRNVIVSDDVLNSDQSIVIQQAANRVVSAQTVLYHLLQAL